MHLLRIIAVALGATSLAQADSKPDNVYPPSQPTLQIDQG